jgi:hypothetical protein
MKFAASKYVCYDFPYTAVYTELGLMDLIRIGRCGCVSISAFIFTIYCLTWLILGCHLSCEGYCTLCGCQELVHFGDLKRAT